MHSKTNVAFVLALVFVTIVQCRNVDIDNNDIDDNGDDDGKLDKFERKYLSFVVSVRIGYFIELKSSYLPFNRFT